jgi:hypothetical protein
MEDERRPKKPEHASATIHAKTVSKSPIYLPKVAL